MAGSRVSDIIETFQNIISKPECFLSSNEGLAGDFMSWTKVIYDILQESNALSSDGDALPELFTEGFDNEQIWQELELKNPSAVEHFLTSISVLKTNEFKINEIKQDYRFDSDDEEREETSDEAENVADELPEDSDISLDLEKEKLEFEGDDSESEEEKELERMLDKVTAHGDEEGSGEMSDEEEGGLFLDLEESPSSKQNKRKNYEFDKNLQENIGKKKRKTVVDDRFFNVADLETYLDREDAREEKRRQKEGGREESDDSDSDEDQEKDADFFADIPSEDEGVSSRNLRYKDFFDPPDGILESRHMDDDKELESEADSPEDREEGSSPVKKDLFAQDDDDTKETKESLSTYQQRQERLSKRINGLEEANLAPKSWQLGGEVSGEARPENSLLQEDLDFEQQTRTAPEITEDTTKTLEDIISQRIKDQSWDDVERKVKPTDTPLEYKKKVVLDMEKSKKSLSEMYEEEYLKQAEKDKEDEELPEHVEIKKMMTSLFIKLDALSNFHYTPKPATSEIKVVSNLPSVTMEEVAPVSVSEAAMLAPEEIKDKQQRELKGDTEKTKEDKTSERRLKKRMQRKQRAEKAKRNKLIEKLNPGLGNKYAKENAINELEKQSKGTRSNVTIIKEGKSKKRSDLTSSSKFFTKLQDQVSSRIKQAKSDGGQNKKQSKNKNSAKFML